MTPGVLGSRRKGSAPAHLICIINQMVAMINRLIEKINRLIEMIDITLFQPGDNKEPMKVRFVTRFQRTLLIKVIPAKTADAST